MSEEKSEGEGEVQIHYMYSMCHKKGYTHDATSACTCVYTANEYSGCACACNLLAQHPHTCRNVRVHPHTLDTESTMLGTAGTACVDIILINSVPKHVCGARVMSIAFLCGTYMYMYMYCTSEIMVVRKAVDKENVNIIIL